MTRSKGKPVVKQLKLWTETWARLREAKYNLDISMEDLANQILLLCLENEECVKNTVRKLNLGDGD